MGIEGVVLEDHRDVARAWWQLGDIAVVDPDRARGHVLEPRKHSEQRRFAAARRPDEDEELAALDLQGDVVDGHDVAAEELRDVLEHDLGHCGGSIPDRRRLRNGIDHFCRIGL